MRLALSLILSAAAVLLIPGSALAADTPILVQLEPGVSTAERADVHDDAGVEHLRSTDLPRTELVDATETSTATALRRLNRDPDVAWAAPNVTLRAAATNDVLFGNQWALESSSDIDIDAPEAWTMTTGVGVDVAVVDTGIQPNHPDLVGGVTGGHDYVDGDAAPVDANGHGTHVSGIIAARANNSVGIAGVSPGSRIIPLRVLDAAGDGSLNHILAAFDDAGNNGVRIVSASLGSDPNDPDAIAAAAAIRDAFNTVMGGHPGTLYVVAAGNETNNNDDPLHPTFPCNATVSNILCVGASEQSDGAALYSNYGATTVDLFAPGTQIESTWIGSGYAPDSGTSMATPMVSGVAALVLSRDGALTTSGLRNAVLSTVEHGAGDAFNGISASGGRVNARAAVASVPPDHDGDRVPDPADACPSVPAPGTNDGCPVPDSDKDDVPNNRDACPGVYARTANGCPAPPKPTTGTVIVDRDGDGRSDSLDACPTENAKTADGCPVPRVRSIKVSKRKKHRVKVRVVADRVATATFRLERRVCNKRGKRCKWRMTATDAVVTKRGAASFYSRTLRKGRYRVAVALSSSSGRAKTQRKTFRI